MTTTHPYGLRPIGSPLAGSTIEDRSYTAYRLADGRWVPFAKADGLRPVEPLVTFG